MNTRSLGLESYLALVGVPLTLVAVADAEGVALVPIVLGLTAVQVFVLGWLEGSAGWMRDR